MRLAVFSGAGQRSSSMDIKTIIPATAAKIAPNTTSFINGSKSPTQSKRLWAQICPKAPNTKKLSCGYLWRNKRYGYGYPFGDICMAIAIALGRLDWGLDTPTKKVAALREVNGSSRQKPPKQSILKALRINGRRACLHLFIFLSSCGFFGLVGINLSISAIKAMPPKTAQVDRPQYPATSPRADVKAFFGFWKISRPLKT